MRIGRKKGNTSTHRHHTQESARSSSLPALKSHTQFRRPGPGKQNVSRPSQLSPPFFLFFTLSGMQGESEEVVKGPEMSSFLLRTTLRVRSKMLKAAKKKEGKEDIAKKINSVKGNQNQEPNNSVRCGESETFREKVPQRLITYQPQNLSRSSSPWYNDQCSRKRKYFDASRWPCVCMGLVSPLRFAVHLQSLWRFWS